MPLTSKSCPDLNAAGCIVGRREEQGFTYRPSALALDTPRTRVVELLLSSDI